MRASASSSQGGIAITLDTYSHVLPGLQEAAAQRFDERLQMGRSEVLVKTVGQQF